MRGGNGRRRPWVPLGQGGRGPPLRKEAKCFQSKGNRRRKCPETGACWRGAGQVWRAAAEEEGEDACRPPGLSAETTDCPAACSLFLLSVIKSLQSSWASAGDHIFQPRGQQDMALRQNLANGQRMDMASAALRAQGGPCSSLSAFRTGGAMAWCWGTTWSMQTRGRPGQSFRRWGPWACGDLSITWKLIEMQIGAPPPDLPN